MKFKAIRKAGVQTIIILYIQFGSYCKISFISLNKAYFILPGYAVMNIALNRCGLNELCPMN